MTESTFATLSRERIFLSEGEIYSLALEHLVNKTASTIGYLHLYNEDHEEIALNVWSESVLAHCETVHDSHYPLRDAGIWADCIRQRKAVIHNDYALEASAEGLPDGHMSLTKHMSVPIFDHDAIVAIVGVGNEDQDYRQQDAEVITDWMAEAWPAIRKQCRKLSERRTAQIQSASSADPLKIVTDMLGAMSRALESRDEYTSLHQKRVAEISRIIAIELDYSADFIFGLYLGALVHDIGKISIPTSILTKPAKLHHAETELLKIHAEVGSGIFRDIDFPWPIREMIEQHHERMNGSGYPRGILGEMIVPEARIIGVADTFEAMVTDRPYRKAPGEAAALDIIKQGRGVTFDTYVVDAFFRCHDRGALWPVLQAYQPDHLGSS